MTSNSQIVKHCVLLHGAWHGPWVFERLRSLLTVYDYIHTPDLNECTSLEKCVDLVIDCIQDIGEPVVLVGHSMAGAIIPQVACHIPLLIKRLIYIAAFILGPGQSVASEEQNAIVPSVIKEVIVRRNTISIKNSFKVKELFYNTCDFETANWAKNLLVDIPLRLLQDPIPISLTDMFLKELPKIPTTFIQCTQDQAIAFQDQQRMLQNYLQFHNHPPLHISEIPEKNTKTLWYQILLDTDHSPFLSKPEALAQILAKI